MAWYRYHATEKHVAHLLRSRRALAGVPKKKGNFDQI